MDIEKQKKIQKENLLTRIEIFKTFKGKNTDVKWQEGYIEALEIVRELIEIQLFKEWK